jgi:hypothetical protein
MSDDNLAEALVRKREDLKLALDEIVRATERSTESELDVSSLLIKQPDGNTAVCRLPIIKFLEDVEELPETTSWLEHLSNVPTAPLRYFQFDDLLREALGLVDRAQASRRAYEELAVAASLAELQLAEALDLDEVQQLRIDDNAFELPLKEALADQARLAIITANLEGRLAATGPLRKLQSAFGTGRHESGGNKLDYLTLSNWAGKLGATRPKPEALEAGPIPGGDGSFGKQSISTLAGNVSEDISRFSLASEKLRADDSVENLLAELQSNLELKALADERVRFYKNDVGRRRREADIATVALYRKLSEQDVGPLNYLRRMLPVATQFQIDRAETSERAKVIQRGLFEILGIDMPPIQENVDSLQRWIRLAEQKLARLDHNDQGVVISLSLLHNEGSRWNDAKKRWEVLLSASDTSLGRLIRMRGISACFDGDSAMTNLQLKVSLPRAAISIRDESGGHFSLDQRDAPEVFLGEVRSLALARPPDISAATNWRNLSPLGDPSTDMEDRVILVQWIGADGIQNGQAADLRDVWIFLHVVVQV